MGAYTTPDDWKREYINADETTAELTRMRVDPDWQGRGLGTAVYRELRARAHSDGYRRFVLDTVDRRSEITVGVGEAPITLALYQRAIEP
jgi:GNAT superfamily N-acetyltransferase